MWLSIAAKWNLMLKFEVLSQLDIGPWIWAQDLHDQIPGSVCVGFTVSCKLAGCCGGERVNFCVCWFINYIYIHQYILMLWKWWWLHAFSFWYSLLLNLSLSVYNYIHICIYIHFISVSMECFHLWYYPSGKIFLRGRRVYFLCCIYAQVIV